MLNMSFACSQDQKEHNDQVIAGLQRFLGLNELPCSGELWLSVSFALRFFTGKGILQNDQVATWLITKERPPCFDMSYWGSPSF